MSGARLDPKEVVGVFDSGGLFSRVLPGYEHRVQQMAMAEAVCQAMNEDGIAVIEAGTGTGKSLAYLVPSILWAKRTEERVVVSTNTINLQEQLINKDIPFLRNHLGLDFRTALVKGRGNYLCRRRFEAWSRMNDDSGTQGAVGVLQRWVRECDEGSRSELPAGIPWYVWSEIMSESESCLKGDCPFYGPCFFMKARKAMGEAEILVVNHHLLFADVAIRRSNPDQSTDTGILPAYGRLVIDEAHNIEDIATEYLGVQVKASDFEYLVSSIYKRRSDNDIRGLAGGLRRLVGFVGMASASPLVADIGHTVEQDLLPLLGSVLEGVSRTFSGIQSFAGTLNPGGNGQVKLRLTRDTVSGAVWNECVGVPLWGLHANVVRLVDILRDIEEHLKSVNETYRIVDESLSTEARAVRIKAEALLKGLGFVMSMDDPGFVYWVEADESEAGPRGAFKAAPLDISGPIRSEILDKTGSVAFTSATLSVNQGFSYFKGAMGIDGVRERTVIEKCIASPFDYRVQTLLCIPMDLPAPEDPAFTENCARAIMGIVGSNRGGTLVLFTSYAMMTVVHGRISEHCSKRGIPLAKQGDQPRNALLERMRTEGNLVLLATDSFWEGIDIPGAALGCVVIAKLPFRVPTDPVQQARHEELEAKGRNPFMHYSLPQAVIRFKQGFGRLIRTRADRGAVVVLDRRILEKRYGRAFIKSLPECRTVSGPTPDVVGALGEWMGSQVSPGITPP